LKLLLDTHILIWFLHSPDRLGAGVRGALLEATNERWLSPISVWEALLLQRKGRLRLRPDFADWVKQSTPAVQQAPLTHEIVLAAEGLDLHDDPADRFIAATALVHDFTLVTADQRLLGLGTIRSLANR
jgi:PIN domain nuclease of toxin-antitoxin system